VSNSYLCCKLASSASLTSAPYLSLSPLYNFQDFSLWVAFPWVVVIVLAVPFSRLRRDRGTGLLLCFKIGWIGLEKGTRVGVT
jgi:hypothetical protein